MGRMKLLFAFMSLSTLPFVRSADPEQPVPPITEINPNVAISRIENLQNDTPTVLAVNENIKHVLDGDHTSETIKELFAQLKLIPLSEYDNYSNLLIEVYVIDKTIIKGKKTKADAELMQNIVAHLMKIDNTLIASTIQRYLTSAGENKLLAFATDLHNLLNWLTLADLKGIPYDVQTLFNLNLMETSGLFNAAFFGVDIPNLLLQKMLINKRSMAKLMVKCNKKSPPDYCILIWNTIKTVFIREDFVAQRFENLKFMDRMPHFHVLHNFAIQVFYNMIQTYNPEPDVHSPEVSLHRFVLILLADCHLRINVSLDEENKIIQASKGVVDAIENIKIRIMQLNMDSERALALQACDFKLTYGANAQINHTEAIDSFKGLLRQMEKVENETQYLGAIVQDCLFQAISIAKNKIGELPEDLRKEAEEDLKFDMSNLNETHEVMQELIMQNQPDINSALRHELDQIRLHANDDKVNFPRKKLFLILANQELIFNDVDPKKRQISSGFIAEMTLYWANILVQDQNTSPDIRRLHNSKLVQEELAKIRATSLEQHWTAQNYIVANQLLIVHHGIRVSAEQQSLHLNAMQVKQCYSNMKAIEYTSENIKEMLYIEFYEMWNPYVISMINYATTVPMSEPVPRPANLADSSAFDANHYMNLHLAVAENPLYGIYVLAAETGAVENVQLVKQNTRAYFKIFLQTLEEIEKVKFSNQLRNPQVEKFSFINLPLLAKLQDMGSSDIFGLQHNFEVAEIVVYYTVWILNQLTLEDKQKNTKYCVPFIIILHKFQTLSRVFKLTPQEFFSRYYAQLFANRTIVVDNLIRESCLPNRQLQSVRESLDVTNLPEDFPNYYVKDKQIVCKHSKSAMVRRTIITYLNTEHNPNSAEHKMAIYAFLLSIEFWEDTNYADKPKDEAFPQDMFLTEFITTAAAAVDLEIPNKAINSETELIINPVKYAQGVQRRANLNTNVNSFGWTNEKDLPLKLLRHSIKVSEWDPLNSDDGILTTHGQLLEEIKRRADHKTRDALLQELDNSWITLVTKAMHAVYADPGHNRLERNKIEGFASDVERFLNIHSSKKKRSDPLFYFHLLINKFNVEERIHNIKPSVRLSILILLKTLQKAQKIASTVKKINHFDKIPLEQVISTEDEYDKNSYEAVASDITEGPSIRKLLDNRSNERRRSLCLNWYMFLSKFEMLEKGIGKMADPFFSYFDYKKYPNTLIVIDSVLFFACRGDQDIKTVRNFGLKHFYVQKDELDKADRTLVDIRIGVIITSLKQALQSRQKKKLKTSFEVRNMVMAYAPYLQFPEAEEVRRELITYLASRSHDPDIANLKEKVVQLTASKALSPPPAQ